MNISIAELQMLNMAKSHYDQQEKKNFSLTLLLVHNSKLIEAELAKFEEARDTITNSEEFKEFQQKRQFIIDAHRIKDEEGNFVTSKENGQVGFKLDDVDAMNGKLANLSEKHKDLLDRVQKNNEEVAEMIKEPIEIPLKKITNIGLLKVLSKNALVGLAPIIEMVIPMEVIEPIADTLTTAELARLTEWCEIDEAV